MSSNFIVLHCREPPLFLLLGDALRLIGYIDTSSSHELKARISQLRTDCLFGQRFAPLANLRFRTPHGLQTVAPDLDEHFSWMMDNRSRPLTVPVVPCPPRDILVSLFSRISEQNVSELPYPWTYAVSPSGLAMLARDFVMPRRLLEAPGSYTSSMRIGAGLRAFLKATPVDMSENDTSPGSPIDVLVGMVPEKLAELYRAYMSYNPVFLAALGFNDLLFKRLFTHLFVNASHVQIGKERMFQLTACLGKGVIYDEDLGHSVIHDNVYESEIFAHLKMIHLKVASCLSILRKAFPQLVSAAGCLTAMHKIEQGEDVTPADLGRSRLFGSAMEARKAIVQIFKSDLRECIVELFYVVQAASSFLNAIRERDFFPMATRCTNGLWFIDQIPGILEKTEFSAMGDVNNPNLAQVLEPLTIARAQFRFFKYGGLLSRFDAARKQMVNFSTSISLTRQELSDSWFPAFSSDAADATATTCIQFLVRQLQLRFDLIEQWTRTAHDIAFAGMPLRMWSLLAQQAGLRAPELLDYPLMKHEALTVPKESKNRKTEDLSFAVVDLTPLPPCPLPTPPEVSNPLAIAAERPPQVNGQKRVNGRVKKTQRRRAVRHYPLRRNGATMKVLRALRKRAAKRNALLLKLGIAGLQSCTDCQVLSGDPE